MKCYAWHEPVWARLTSRLDEPAHALLVHGRKGVGKLDLAELYAKTLLCEARPRRTEPCGECAACGWFALGNHPDYRLVIPEADADPGEDERPANKTASKQIRIDQVRQLQEWLAVPGHRGTTRVAILHPGEAMNPATQNALLKTLEEPTPGAVLVIVSHKIERLLPTVRSRCRSVPIAPPSTAAALEWLGSAGVESADRLLALSGGAPLAAAERPHLARMAAQLAEELASQELDPVRLADGYQTANLTEVIDLVQKWMLDLLAARLGAPARYFVGFEKSLAQAAATIAPERATAWWRELAQSRGLVDHPLNARLVLESLFIGYRSVRSR